MDMPFSLSDVAAVTRDGNDSAFGGNGAWWIIILFLFVFMGGGLWGNRGDYGQYATAATGAGYYLVTMSATVAPTAAGAVTITGQKDGVAIIGATATSTAAAGAATDLAFSAIVRNIGCGSSILSFVLTGAAATVSNFAVSVVKL